MTQRGEQRLRSGNIFRWTQIEIGRRGSLSGDFQEEPSAADIAEAKAFAHGRKPDAATTVGHGVCSAKERDVIRNAHLFGNGNQN